MDNKTIYTELWSGVYKKRLRPHGNNYVRASQHLAPKGSLADWGCGQGRVLKQFQEDGLSVVGSDVAYNSLDDDVDIPFVCGSICDVKIDPVEYSMCFDVLEHLEEDDIPGAIANVMAHTKKRAYFRIAMKDDLVPVFGVPTNLHKTVKNMDWWRARFLNYFMVWDKEDNQGIYNIIVENE